MGCANTKSNDVPNGNLIPKNEKPKDVSLDGTTTSNEEKEHVKGGEELMVNDIDIAKTNGSVPEDAGITVNISAQMPSITENEENKDTQENEESNQRTDSEQVNEDDANVQENQIPNELTDQVNAENEEKDIEDDDQLKTDDNEIKDNTNIESDPKGDESTESNEGSGVVISDET